MTDRVFRRQGGQFIAEAPKDKKRGLEVLDEAPLMAKLEKLTAGKKATPAKKPTAAPAKKAPAKKPTANKPRKRAAV